MKKIVVIATALLFVAGITGFAQDKNVASPKKSSKDQTAVKQNPASPTTADKTAPQQPTPPRPKLSKEDSLKRVHRIDSIRKVIAEKRGKEGFPVLSKQDSIKRAHKIDSLRKIARERKQAGSGGPQPYKPRMSKEDSLKRTHLMDSLKNAAAARQKTAPVKQEKK